MNIGDRIKRYEASSKISLLPNGFVFLRIDGKSFHTFTRGMGKPFDHKLMEAMVVAGEETVKHLMGFRLGYHQSDEFSFLITDTQSFNSQLWFDGDVQKLCSVTASIFTAYFNRAMCGTVAAFDCRAFNVPKDDVANVFVWRQKDWARNSLQMYARSFFSHKQMHGKKNTDIHEMLHRKGLNWSDLSEQDKNGTFITQDGRRVHKEMNYDEINQLCTKFEVTD